LLSKNTFRGIKFDYSTVSMMLQKKSFLKDSSVFVVDKLPWHGKVILILTIIAFIASWGCFSSSIMIFFGWLLQKFFFSEAPNWLESCLNSWNRHGVKVPFNDYLRLVIGLVVKKLFLRKKSESNQKVSRDYYCVFLLYWPKKLFVAWLKSNVHFYLWEHHSACILISF